MKPTKAKPEAAPKLKKRKWIYVQRPAVYEIAPCECGNADPDWSEYAGRLWCKACKKDFVPAHNGIFDGPIAVNACRMMGIVFDRYVIKTKTVEPFEYNAKS